MDQLWRALLNVSRRLRSRLKRCDTSSLNAPALLLLPVAPNLRQPSRQPNQRQPPRSPDLRRRGAIEGANARQDATTSLSAKDPGPRLPWIQCLRSLPDQPGRRRRGPSLATAGPHRKRPLMCLLPPRGMLGAEKNVFSVPHWSATAPRCPTAVIADKIKHKLFQKESTLPFLPPISIRPLCSQSAQPFQPLAMRAEAWQDVNSTKLKVTCCHLGITVITIWRECSKPITKSAGTQLLPLLRYPASSGHQTGQGTTEPLPGTIQLLSAAPWPTPLRRDMLSQTRGTI